MIDANVLITSISRKVSLIREVKKALSRITVSGRVIGADSDPKCIGRFFTDDFWLMPLMQSLTVEEILRYCLQNNVRFIIPTRDGELLFFARYREAFNENGIAVMVSSPDSVQTCLDKKKFWDILKNQDEFTPIATFDRPIREYGQRWVVKECFGAGSRTLLLNVSEEEACNSLDRYQVPICQPYIEGQEYSSDLYISQKSIPMGCVVRKRDVVVHGESQVTTTVARPNIERACLKAIERIGLTGHAVFQLIEDKAGSMHFLECNCRFGGASTLGVAVGLDSFYWFFRESIGDDLSDIPFVRCSKKIRQIRFAQDRIIELDEN